MDTNVSTLRDGSTCANPRCKRKLGLMAHHLVFRSEEGPTGCKRNCRLRRLPCSLSPDVRTSPDIRTKPREKARPSGGAGKNAPLGPQGPGVLNSRGKRARFRSAREGFGPGRFHARGRFDQGSLPAADLNPAALAAAFIRRGGRGSIHCRERSCGAPGRPTNFMWPRAQAPTRAQPRSSGVGSEPLEGKGAGGARPP